MEAPPTPYSVYFSVYSNVANSLLCNLSAETWKYLMAKLGLLLGASLWALMECCEFQV